MVGDTEIRKGEGMELDQLFQSTIYVRERNTCIHPFDLDILREAFQMKETTHIELSSVRHGISIYLFVYVSYFILFYVDKCMFS